MRDTDEVARYAKLVGWGLRGGLSVVASPPMLCSSEENPLSLQLLSDPSLASTSIQLNCTKRVFLKGLKHNRGQSSKKSSTVT